MDSRDAEYVSALVQKFMLTPRQAAVAKLMFKGLSIRAIAAQYDRSVGTVKALRAAVYRKIGQHSESGLVKEAYEAWIDANLTGDSEPPAAYPAG
jgi:DNA-binding NarL/FixJ family response regulator